VDLIDSIYIIRAVIIKLLTSYIRSALLFILYYGSQSLKYEVSDGSWTGNSVTEYVTITIGFKN